MTQPPKEWKELPPEQIEQAIRGSRKDLEALVRWYGPIVSAAVTARVRGVPTLAVQVEDLVNSVWLELCRNGWKRLRYYDRSRGELGSFIRLQASQIAWKLVLRQLDRPELVDEAVPEVTDDGLESRVLSREFLERLAARARARLGESDWAVFNATYVEGLTSEEIAWRLEKPPKAVYQQKYRLRAKLEAIVRELLAEERAEPRTSGPLVQHWRSTQSSAPNGRIGRDRTSQAPIPNIGIVTARARASTTPRALVLTIEATCRPRPSLAAHRHVVVPNGDSDSR